ncbi:aminotransferase class V-fold PLP-dependent enzyme [bacterium M00.F.Ca.ET.228.01.1.1]|uniref:aminotransferase class V-fold PLP-dependent enzyme n=1 Tax=Paraburkholderia phenoliruptrix TaxID=252970 RepID=UPI001092A336|nr:aminotransferase class V-fold PLP-dependent enzyme [Paraburkholderia phenoliruptrix]TGP39829.1 aminotransferase class V-fold PLP-dependent enzyme [bacterium M00.F.Ca.ET.228.01.1.1]TGR95690.1 aminotransferase class V-fold PLP-dependent enzyme [bacterium M00.F.Ca.ET.191.01.1.1]TGT96706.1 aminotransferase class V-fold PLP-dependent enzyme [bacterium M00.F.Ca.ET.155.01.1.1]MBW0448101.1 aminotransferase class V-fold PLP-dependent enzyme [Paraburkholderia phenoliruptrix]MBW9100208.1 aminotransfer
MSASLSPTAVDALRASTPGAQSTTHFNHAGASLPSSVTLEAIRAHLWREATLGPMEAGVVAREQTERARLLAAQLLNAKPAEIALTTGNSPGWGAAFAALGPWQPGDRILVGRHEWGGNLAAMRLVAQRAGVSIEVIPSDASGAVDPQALEAILDDRVRLIALTWLPANGGLINPAAAIGRVARRHGIPYFIDAAQAVGQLPVDVVEVGCDVLSGAGRKALRGPRGTGLLYVRQDFLSRLTPAFVDTRSAPLDLNGEPVLRNDAAQFESAEASLALRCGLANALQEALDIGIDNIRARIDGIAKALRVQLADIPGVTVLDQGVERSGLVAFNVVGLDALSVQRSLAAQGISIGSNGVGYTPMDMAFRGLEQIARASVSYLTTELEIGKLLEGIRTLTH